MYIPLGENNRLKLFFTTLGYADHYEGISISAADKNNGVIDKNTIKFADVWGKKQVNNPNFREGITPYIWKDGNQTQWYVYKPTPRDMQSCSDKELVLTNLIADINDLQDKCCGQLIDNWRKDHLTQLLALAAKEQNLSSAISIIDSESRW